MRPPPPNDTTQLFLIRHGATPANEQRPYILQGSGIDLPLSFNGEQQVAALATFLGDFPIHHVYCSALKRACQTAEAVATPHGLKIQPVDGLIECDVGNWEGLDWESIKAQDPEYWELFHQDPAAYPYLGGESYQDVYGRVRPVIHELLARHRGENIVIVAHNIVNRVYLAGLLGLELRLAVGVRQQNACVNVIHHTSDGTSLSTMNSTFHLDHLNGGPHKV